ncbi:MAG: SH3 domain-containing protein [Elainellaceae cyanobacterium]
MGRLTPMLKAIAMLMGSALVNALAACQPEVPEAAPSSWPTETAPALDSAPVETAPVSLVPVRSAAETESPESSGEPATLAASDDQDIIVYEEPSTDAADVASATSGDRARILKAQRSSGGGVWYYGQFDAGVEGWVQGTVVTFSETDSRTSRPLVVLPGGGQVYTQPSADSELVQDLEGGSVIAAEQRRSSDKVWFYSGGGWITGESLFHPTCVEFNGYLPLIVVPGGTTVHDTAAYQIPVKNRLDGGELVFPFDRVQNSTGTWFETDQGWISGQSLFYPFCEANSAQPSQSSDITPPNQP